MGRIARVESLAYLPQSVLGLQASAESNDNMHIFSMLYIRATIMQTYQPFFLLQFLPLRLFLYFCNQV